MDKDRRHPLKKFDPTLIEDFLGNKQIISVELLSGGKCNSNYKVKLSDGNTYVVRLYSRVRPDFECYVMRLVSAVVPVPEIVYYNDKCAVLTFLLGKTLQEVPQFSDKAAEMIAKISSITFDVSGELKSDGTITPWSFGGIRGFIEQSICNDKVLHWIGKTRRLLLQDAIERNSVLYKEMDAMCCLVHGDFKPCNILIAKGEVSGILDWEFSHVGTPYMDIANLLRNTESKYHEKIHSVLIKNNSLPSDWKKRAQLVGLTSHLEFLTTNRADSFKKECVAKIDTFLSLDL